MPGVGVLMDQHMAQRLRGGHSDGGRQIDGGPDQSKQEGGAAPSLPDQIHPPGESLYRIELPLPAQAPPEPQVGQKEEASHQKHSHRPDSLQNLGQDGLFHRVRCHRPTLAGRYRLPLPRRALLAGLGSRTTAV